MGYRPWAELSHPWGTSLYDLEFHIVFIPVAVGSANDIECLKVAGLYIPQGDFIVAESKDAVPMRFNQLHEASERLDSAPLELGFPCLPELECIALVGVIPEVSQGFLEPICLGKLGACGQDGIEGFPCIAADACSAGQQYELLAGKGLPETAQGASKLCLANRIKGIVEMPDNMKLIVNDFSLDDNSIDLSVAVCQNAFLEGPAHINDCMRDTGSTLLAEPLPEAFEPFFRASFHNVKHFWTPGSFQSTEECPVVMPLANADFVHSQYTDTVQRAPGLNFLQDNLVDVFDSVPMEPEEDRYCLDRSNLAQLMYEGCQRTGYPRTAYSDKPQGLCLYPAIRTVDTITLETDDRPMLPEHQVTQFLCTVVIAPGYMAPAATTDVSFACPFQMQPHKAAPVSVLYLFNIIHVISPLLYKMYF